MNNSKACWAGLKQITGYVTKRESLCVDDDNKFVNELNDFYCRFDCHNFKKEHNDIMSSFKTFLH